MAELAASKKQLGVTEEDIISSLPDCILLHILSFLPLRTCVMTSFLSLRWRDIWKDLQVMDLDESFEDFERQAVFVNSAIRLSKSFKYLRKLSVSCLRFCDIPAKWLCDVCGPQSHLEELHFLIYDGINSVDEKFDENGDAKDPIFRSLPLSPFVSTNLVKLSLARGIYLNLESISEVCLSSLKTLTIRWMLTDITSMNVLLAGCPVLEDLHITSLILESSGGIRVPSSLKRLRIQLGYLEIDDYDHIDDIPWASLQINAPRLEYFELGDMTLDRVSNINNLQNVIKANLDLIEPYDNLFLLSPDNCTSTLIEFLHLLTGIQHLVLRLRTTMWLLSASRLNFPEYRHLRHLELNLPHFNSYLVFSLLEKCQVLQVLIIQNGGGSTEHTNLPKWVQKTSVSNCVEYHLTSLHIKGFQGDEDEMGFAQYILQKGLVLNTMNITSNLKEKLGVLKSLSNMPRGSATCQLQFNGCASH